MDYIIGLDTGTSNTKAIAFSINGEIIGEASVGYHSLPSAGAGFNEQDPEILFDSMISALSRLIAKLSAHNLLGISFSCAMHSLIAVDTNGKPLTNVITWADLRSTEYAKRLRNTPVGKELHSRTGTPVHPMSPLCKIQWIRDLRPDIFRAAFKFISIKEYFFHKLFAKYLIDHSIASATGLFDLFTLLWNGIALKTAGITADQLSQPVSTTHIESGMNTIYADLLGIDALTPCIIGGSDGCLANLGSNAVMPGDVSLTIGTSGAVRMIVNKPSTDEKQHLFNYILTDSLYVSGGPINNGGILLKWYAENFLKRSFENSSDFEWFVNEASQVEAGCDGLIFLPYVQGERAPVWDAEAKGIFFGVHSGHTQLHFMRAIVEGICYSLYQVAESIECCIGEIKRIYASGGFIRSRQWLQILADVFNKQIDVTNASDASAVGAAILGLKALGVINELEDAKSFFTVSDSITPNESNHLVYKRYMSVYNRLYEQSKESFHLLHKLQHQ